MTNVVKSLTLAVRQLGDPAILRILLKTAVLTILIIAILGAGFGYGAYRLLIEWGVAFSAEIGAIVGVILAILGGWLMFRIVAIAVMQFFADEIVLAVEQCHYPECVTTTRKLPFREDLSNSLRGIGRASLFNALALPVALILLFTAIGPAIVFLLVNAVLLGRELTDMGWLRHRASPSTPSPVGAFDRLLLGGAIAGLMAIPFANLLAPVIGAAAGTHLVQLSREKQPIED